jgi:hypothetical protein
MSTTSYFSSTTASARHVLRIQKTFEDANIKLDSVIIDLMGVSGRKMIEALIAGQHNPARLKRLADHRVKLVPGV